MSDSIHARARQLIAVARGNGMAADDQAWLESHLLECPACAQFAGQLEGVVRALRSVSVMPSPGLVSATQLRVRARAREIQERQARFRPLWIACAVAILISVITTPYLWWGFSWAAHSLGLPDLLWQAGFLMAWALPAVLVASLVIAWRTEVDRRDELEMSSRG